MTTPADYPSALVASLWGGVAADTSGPDFTAECATAQASAMNAESRRRQLAAQSPGLGAQVPMPQPYAGPGPGLAGVPGLEVVGEGYGTMPPADPFQHKAYGETRPAYAPAEVGYGTIASAVSRLGSAARARRPDAGVVLVSPGAAPRRSLLGKMLGRLRRR